MENLHIKQNSDTSEDCLSFDIMLDEIMIGKCQLRTTARKSSDLPEGFESHIYYEIDEQYRGKGYAIQVLKLVLVEAKKLGFEKVLLSVSEHNPASIKVIEKNGGVLIKTGVTVAGEDYRLYEITIHI